MMKVKQETSLLMSFAALEQEIDINTETKCSDLSHFLLANLKDYYCSIY